MELFAREYGPADAPVILLLHGAEHSGMSWQPVVGRLPQYRCLVPDLPQHGQSVQEEPFNIHRAASAVAELIRSRAGTDRVHLVGHSLGAQVGAQLLAAEPRLIDRTVLCGTVINPLPGVWLTRNLLGLFAGLSRSREIAQSGQENALPPPEGDDDPDGVRLMSAGQFSEIVVASAGFTIPEGLDRTDSPALLLTGGLEHAVVHQSAATLSRQIPNGVAGIAQGMHHNWPLRNSSLFARTVDGWLSDTALPSEIVLSPPDRRRSERSYD
jgi:pimeloyl-ACP methyl ester carboxylesterase